MCLHTGETQARSCWKGRGEKRYPLGPVGGRRLAVHAYPHLAQFMPIFDLAHAHHKQGFKYWNPEGTFTHTQLCDGVMGHKASLCSPCQPLTHFRRKGLYLKLSGCQHAPCGRTAVRDREECQACQFLACGPHPVVALTPGLRPPAAVSVDIAREETRIGGQLVANRPVHGKGGHGVAE